MIFSSMTFLWIFLPCVLFIYYAFSFVKNKSLQVRFKNIVLLISSLIFYAWGGLYYLLVMVISILGNYFFALIIDKYDSKNKSRKRKIALIMSIIFNLGLLFYFKYFNFFGNIVENIVNMNLGLKEVVLPIGISFFTFQSMSYVIDVYLKRVECQKNLMLVALYVSFFPQLIAGPIVKYKDIENQLLHREESAEKFVVGIKRFIVGLGKKVIISNTLGAVVEVVFSSSLGAYGSMLSWIAILFYSLQIYFDFSGYSDMAIGLGKMFGFDFNENFNYPYTAVSVQDFWRRWHISLSTWFKEYVYIPLGGNRKGKARTYINLFIVFLLTGIWHGANYTFIVWGLIYGLFLVVERVFLGKLLNENKFKFLNWLYTMLVVVILWVFFRAPDISYAFKYISILFGFRKEEASIWGMLGFKELLAFLFGLIFAFNGLSLLKRKIKKGGKLNKILPVIEYVSLLTVFFVSVLLLINNTFNPFIYFQF